MKIHLLYFPILFFNSIISFLFLINEIEINVFYYLISLCLFVLILLKNRNNIIFFVRTFFLGIIGFIAMGAKIVNASAFFGFHMQDSQTVEIATVMFLFTNIALFSSEIGFNLAKFTKVKKVNHIKNENFTFFLVTFFLLIISAIMMDISMGPDIISGPGYAQFKGEKFDSGLGNLNTIVNSLFLILILLYFKFKDVNNYSVKKLEKYILFVGLYIYVYVNFLHGARLDALNGLFGIFIMISIYKNLQLKINLKIFIIGVGLFIIMQMIGAFRSILGNLTLDEILIVMEKTISYLIENPNTGIMFYQGTINDIATTFSGIIYMLNENIKDFLYGESYLDYILRTPPAFIYPNRPEDLAFIFKNNGFTSGGGFFELAEAYYNFGYLGAFIIPFLVSYLIGYSYKQFFINRYSVFSSLLFFALISSFMRGILYQTFAFYKSLITVIILYIIIIILSYFIQSIIKKKVLVKNENNN